jgi:hypothetical protein
VGGACGTHRRENCTKFWWESRKERHHFCLITCQEEIFGHGVPRCNDTDRRKRKSLEKALSQYHFAQKEKSHADNTVPYFTRTEIARVSEQGAQKNVWTWGDETKEGCNTVDRSRVDPRKVCESCGNARFPRAEVIFVTVHRENIHPLRN